MSLARPELPPMHPLWGEAENTRVYGIDVDPDGKLWSVSYTHLTLLTIYSV